jgi:hypothetical protein
MNNFYLLKFQDALNYLRISHELSHWGGRETHKIIFGKPRVSNSSIINV